MLHDGCITEWAGDEQQLTLTVDCQYLAELLNPAFSVFYVELVNIKEVRLDPWSNPFDSLSVSKTDLAAIFQAELEILSAEVINDSVVVSCNQYDARFDYCGGNLMINCQAITLFDQGRTELTIDQLKEVCRRCWRG